MDFWNYVASFVFIGLCEIWLEDKGWERIKGRLPDTHTWENIHAVRTSKKGRVMGGLLVGIRKNWGSIGEKNENVLIREGIVHTRILNEGKGLNIFTIYNAEAKGKIEEIIAKISEKCEEHEGEDIILRGDFNIRISNLGGCGENEYDPVRE